MRDVITTEEVQVVSKFSLNATHPVCMNFKAIMPGTHINQIQLLYHPTNDRERERERNERKSTRRERGSIPVLPVLS